MKKLFLSLTFIVLSALLVSAQQTKSAAEITEKQWQSLISALKSENWSAAFDMSTSYLTQVNDSDEVARTPTLRYMALHAAAGRVFDGTMTYDDLEKFIKGFAGKKLIFPFRQISVKKQGFNLVIPSDLVKNKAMVTAVNKAGTTILAFEYIEFKENFDFSAHDGKAIAIGGIVKSIAPNPNRSKTIVMRIYVSDGYVIFPGP